MYISKNSFCLGIALTLLALWGCQDPMDSEVFEDTAAEATSSVADAAAQELVVAEAENVFEGVLRPRQTLSHVLSSHELPEATVNAAVSALRALIDLRKLQPGHEYRLELNADGSFKRFWYGMSRELQYVVEASPGGMVARQEKVLVEVRPRVISGTIESSLFESLLKLGHSSAIAMKLIEAFQWDINFYTDVQKGDSYEVLVEEVYVEGKLERLDRVLMASYQGSSIGKKEAYYYEGDYFDATGRYLQRSFLTTPLSVLRVTSRFGQRFHPVLKISRPHRGVDYGAARGTPVWSVADGKVIWAGQRGDGYGRQVMIEHASGYVSRYAHLNRVSVKRGQVIQQKRKIGEVGSSGLATGPHLHFEILSRGKQINPARLKMLPTVERKVKDKDAFLEEQARLSALMSQTLLASRHLPGAAGQEVD